jgi:hypothetical protein
MSRLLRSSDQESLSLPTATKVKKTFWMFFITDFYQYCRPYNLQSAFFSQEDEELPVVTRSKRTVKNKMADNEKDIVPNRSEDERTMEVDLPVFTEVTTSSDVDLGTIEAGGRSGSTDKDNDLIIMQTVAAEEPNDHDNDDEDHHDEDHDDDYFEYGSRQWEELEGFFKANFSLQEAIKR